MEMQKHGGPRTNSGKKTELLGEPTHRVQVTLDETTVRLLRVVGAGNVSRGVRNAARTAYGVYQRSG